MRLIASEPAVSSLGPGLTSVKQHSYLIWGHHPTWLAFKKSNCCLLQHSMLAFRMLSGVALRGSILKLSPYELVGFAEDQPDREGRQCTRQGSTGKADMKFLRFNLSLLVSLLVFAATMPAIPVHAQDQQNSTQSAALMRGYRTGYSDGYQAGVADVASSTTRDYRAKADYEHADRGYNSTYGPVEEYRDGYQQGFETGYAAGYDRQPFDSSIPTNLKRRDQADNTASNNAPAPTANNYPSDPNQPTPTVASGGTIAIPRDTVMTIELLSNVSSDASHKGDRFEARVVDPKEYESATIEGTVTEIKRPGKVHGTAELQLAFNEIRMPDGRSARMSAQVIEVVRGGEGVGKVDQEGGVQGQDTTKRDVQKVGIGAGIGAAIGAIAGGGVGAAVGAGVGAGVGTAGVMTERGRDVRLYHGQQLRIRTAGDTAIQ